ncbi:Hpt domain-containing protein [Thiobacillus sp.]|uniref:hybrid sensor histidine kinase/response regulator n=1 Tax=Thiobacillus sp. TaxID=924 RepID=UPI0011D33CF0|nr:Hpt domain-containing protein [Thiobacillus sp.]TXH72353.1 MAG: hybrid sensor histidine kinase/response regulator [Thiobacillus sp.]
MSALLDYDTGPLNWVRGDIDAALQAALGRVQAYSVDADLTNALRLAADDAHQVTGALRMVGLEGAATLASALESALGDVNENRLQANDEVLRALRNAIEGLQRWVKDLADGRGSGELALFPLYKRLRELQGAERVFEGELFFPDLRTRAHAKAANDAMTQETLAAEVKTARGLFQRGLLAFLRNVEAEQGLKRMRDALAAIERIAPSQASQTFWWACVGFVDSLIAHGVEADFHVKQLLARVDLQMRRLMEGSPQVAERLLRDALFFVAKSQTLDGRAAEVRATFGLDRYLPGRGMLDPEALARMRPVLDALQASLKAARDSWHAYVEGDAGQLPQFQTHLERMQPQAQALEASKLKPLLGELAAAAAARAVREGDAREQMDLEIAATLLFMQNAVDQEDVLHSDFAIRAEGQQARLLALIEGREMPAVVVDANSQREAERDMLVHMAQEVGQNLKQMEDALDAFFRDAGEREALAGVPALAQQAQGALTMLELPDAAGLLGAATATVQAFAEEGYPDEATQQRLADAFSSLGLYIESYCAGRADAARILRPVLIEFGVIDPDSADDSAFDDTVESGLPARKTEVQENYLAWRDQSDDATKKKFLDTLTELNRDAELIDDAELKRQTRAALDACRDAMEAPLALDADVAALTGLPLPERVAIDMPVALEDETEATLPAIDLRTDDAFDNGVPNEAQADEAAVSAYAAIIETVQPAATEAASAAETGSPGDDAPGETLLHVTIPEGSEAELLEIFLEEANEVLAAMGEASEACQANPDDQAALTIIRRGFHTLKGSGRMVGLDELGETAWRHEQLMNGWLAENKPASGDLLRLVGRARGVFQDWVNALQANQPASLPVPALLAAVDRVTQGRALDEVPASAAVESVASTSAANESDVSGAVAENEAPLEQVQDVATEPAIERDAAVDETPLIDAATECDEPDQQIVAETVIEHEEAVVPLDMIAIHEGVAAESDAGSRAHEDEVAPVDSVASQIESDQPGTMEMRAEADMPDVGAIIEYAIAPAVAYDSEPSIQGETASTAETPAEPPAAVQEHSEPLDEALPAEPTIQDEICIGPVCLSAGLYEIFMTEAHQRLAVLTEEAERHAEAEHSSVSEHARRAIHTLGGIAGTAGITTLSDLSHAFEQYWNRFVHVPMPTSHLSLVQDTVARLHEMIASIEKGHLPDAADDLIATLGELEDEQTSLVADVASTPVQDGAGEMNAPSAEVQEQEAPVEPAAAVHAELAPALPDISALVPDIKHTAPAPIFERREVADEIDQQLLPIFLEEADTLVPDTSAQLRAWKEAPAGTGPRDALRRNLHTIKGSARMVGAMRLGELTHVMESRVIAVIEGHLAASHDVFDTLEAQLDRLADAVEHLKQGDLAPALEDAPAPLEAPVEPVLGRADPAAAATPDPLAPATPVTRESNALTLRVRADWVDRMVNQAGEVAIARSRIESEVFAFKRHVNELSEALVRLRGHIREVEIQAESQMQATFQTQGAAEEFDPLEFDRFTRFQEVTRFLAESVNDISTVQHILLARLGEADAALIQQTRLNRELQQDLLRVRMVPLYSVAERLYRTVRQTARDVDKRAQLDIQGGDLEIDRSVLEKVTAPLEHLLRNALAHGIEDPEVRRAAGKAEFGEIVLSARQTGNEMMLTVKDDGAGLNYARIREKAEANGLLLPGVEPTESLLAQMIFAAGFSTAETVSQVAGRGVGMDVVKSEISALGGRIDITSTPGAGTAFNIYLPLTLAMTQAVMIQAAKHDYALPAPLVQQVLELKPHELEQAMAAGELTWRGARYPFSYLPHLLGDIEAVHEVQRYNPVVLLKSGSSQAAVLLDAIEGTREIVVKNIGPQMARITGVAGATVRGDGRVILILNPVPLALRWASLPRTAVERAVPAETAEVSAALQPPLVLVVDDSLTVRKITTRLLTREGFRVDSAKDGVDALEKMHDLIPDVVLLDVEMPRMDGFELARVMRSDARLKTVPIIMITSRTADKHRNHAMEIGVNVYLGKPYQEQQLLDSIAEQLGQEAAVPA